jgi:TolA-binding protein
MRQCSRLSSNRPLFATLLLFALTGCMSKSDGEALRKDIEALKSQISSLQLQSEKERKKLQEVMEKATRLLTRNSADIGAQVDRLQTKVAKISGTAEEAARKVSELGKKYSDFQAKVDVRLEKIIAGVPEKKQNPVPTDAAQLFKEGRTKIARGRHKEGRRYLGHFVRLFPKDKRAPQAWLWLGHSYFRQGKFANAIQEYAKVIKQYGRSNAVPDALFHAGMAFWELKYCSDARKFLSELLVRHRRHPLCTRAKKVIKLIRKFRKNKRFCAS